MDRKVENISISVRFFLKYFTKLKTLIVKQKCLKNKDDIMRGKNNDKSTFNSIKSELKS